MDPDPGESQNGGVLTALHTSRFSIENDSLLSECDGQDTLAKALVLGSRYYYQPAFPENEMQHQGIADSLASLSREKIQYPLKLLNEFLLFYGDNHRTYQ